MKKVYHSALLKREQSANNQNFPCSTAWIECGTARINTVLKTAHSKQLTAIAAKEVR